MKPKSYPLKFVAFMFEMNKWAKFYKYNPLPIPLFISIIESEKLVFLIKTFEMNFNFEVYYSLLILISYFKKESNSFVLNIIKFK